MVNTGDALVRVALRLDPVMTVNEKTTFGLLSLCESFGALVVFLMLVVSPIMSLINGNHYYISLFKNLYWVNEAGPDDNLEESTLQKSPQEYAKYWS